MQFFQLIASLMLIGLVGGCPHDDDDECREGAVDCGPGRECLGERCGPPQGVGAVCSTRSDYWDDGCRDDLRCEPVSRTCQVPPPCGAGCVFDDVTGLASCDQGTTTNHVAGTQGCPELPLLQDRPANSGCIQQSDCGAGEACVPAAVLVGGEGEAEYASCVPTCVVDDDCRSDQACLCGSVRSTASEHVVINECVKASCRTSADCGGFECGVAKSLCGQTHELACHTADDFCYATNSQCDGCFFDGDTWQMIQGDICD